MFVVPAVSLRITLLPVKLEFVNIAEGPLDITGETVAVTVTLPTKPLMLARAIAEVPNEPWEILNEAGSAPIVKGATVRETWTDLVAVPLAPVTITV